MSTTKVTVTVNGKIKPQFSNKRLSMQGLKPSDYYLYKSMKDYFHFDMRQLFVLGLRYLYSNAHDPEQREKIRYIAHTINGDDLDAETLRPDYHSFTTLMQ